MDCTNCGAPLSPTSNICPFCKTLNDTDLRAIGQHVDDAAQSQRRCPRCSQTLVTMNVGESEPLSIDRCPQCLGIFFDTGELQAVLDDNVADVHQIDFQRLKELKENEHPVGDADKTVRYIKCPVCNKTMNRRVFGKRSGVIVDSCRDHGVWLDGGELGQLMRWTKAGGQLYDEKRKEEERRAAEIRDRAESRVDRMQPTRLGDSGWNESPTLSSFTGRDMIRIMRVIRRLFW